MEKLKEFKNKHDHLFTKILKVSIFSLVMLAPMFAVLAKCLYTLNPNAKESYYGESINEEQIVNVNTIQYNNKYQITFDNTTIYNSNTNYIEVSMLQAYSNTQDIQVALNNILDNITYFRIMVETINNETFIALNTYNSDYVNNFSRYINTNDRIIVLTFNSLSTSDYQFQKLYVYQYNEYSYVDNVFYYSVNQIGNEQIFSWTKQTAIYNAVNTMTSGLGIDPTNNILAVLLTYWTLITAVYVIIDIVLELFIKITHFIS